MTLVPKSRLYQGCGIGDREQSSVLKYGLRPSLSVPIYSGFTQGNAIDEKFKGFISEYAGLMSVMDKD